MLLHLKLKTMLCLLFYVDSLNDCDGGGGGRHQHVPRLINCNEYYVKRLTSEELLNMSSSSNSVI